VAVKCRRHSVVNAQVMMVQSVIATNVMRLMIRCLLGINAMYQWYDEWANGLKLPGRQRDYIQKNRDYHFKK
jgi:hypothetical protein